MIRTFKYKLKPTAAQATRLDSWLHTCRAVYNLALEQRIWVYQSTGRTMSRFDQYYELKALRAEFDWVKDTPSQIAQQVIDLAQQLAVAVEYPDTGMQVSVFDRTVDEFL